MSRKILLVDDEKYKVNAFERSLRVARIEAEFLNAFDGIHGLNIFDANPEIKDVVTDLEMPKSDGYRLISGLIDREYRGRILVNSSASREKIDRALKMGATIFIPDNLGWEEYILFLKNYFEPKLDSLEYRENKISKNL